MNRSFKIPVGPLLFSASLLLWLLSLTGAWTNNGFVRWSAGSIYITYDTWLIFYVVIALRSLRFDQQSLIASASHMSPPTIAVVISARNEELSIANTLDALLTQEDKPEEIWLIDDGSTDDMLSVLSQRYGVTAKSGGFLHSILYPNLHVISKANSGKADSLNSGIAASVSQLVITLDADTVLRKHAVGAMRRAFTSDAHLVAAGGVLTPRSTAGRAGKIFEWFQTYEYIRSFIARVAWSRANALLLVSGAFACYRRSALDKIGGFAIKSWVEDYEITHRLHRYAHEHDLHWRIGIVSEAAAITDVPGSLAVFLRQRRRWFGGFIQTLFGYRKMIGSPRYKSVGCLMLPVKVLDTLQPFFGLTAIVLLLISIAHHETIPALTVEIIAIKFAIDFTFLLWGLSFYNRWSEQQPSSRQKLMAMLAALSEPFFFQWLRHLGALLGWFAVLTQRVDWQPQRSNVQRTSATTT